ncbi:MAG: penicillin acylase family protein [Bdellovibrionota bacterium]|nr:penicillin acylase family protein [Bdellovibrionota bacterium]
MKKVLLLLFTILTSYFSVRYFFFTRSIPQRNGEIQLKGLEDVVSVKYDKNGIPHIKAQNNKDAYFAMGYILGQHRLFQIDIQRRIATGRLSEILGNKTVEIDKMNRSLGFRYYGQQMADSKNWSKETGELLNAYLNGLNHFVKNGKLGIEFTVLNYSPDLFTVADIHAFIGYMGFTFQEAIKQEPLISLLKEKLSPEKMQLLLNSYETDSPAIDKSISQAIGWTHNSSKNFAIKSSFKNALQQNESFGFSLDGSNSWVISGEKSLNGSPMVANDPHISHSNPNVWFEGSIETPNEKIHGHFLSFIPFPVLGWTPRHAWTLTMSEVDDMDLFELKRAKDDFFVGDRKIESKKVEESIKIKGETEQKIFFYHTEYGFILDNIIQFGKDSDSLAAFWTFNAPENHVLEGIRGMTTADSLEEFKASVEKPTAPGLSISYADIGNNIAWFVLGRTLERPEGHNGLGIRIPEIEQTKPKLLDFSNNPSLINPPDFYIATANHLISHEKWEKFPGYYQPSDRGRRINEMLEEKERFSLEEFKELIHDNRDWFFPRVKDLFIKSFEIQKDQMDPEVFNQLKNATEAIATRDNVVMPFYRVWMRQMSRLAMLDEIGEEGFNELFKTPIRHNAIKQLLLDPNNPWWDDEGTKDFTESIEDHLGKAGSLSLIFLKKKLGKNQSQWNWGKLHTLELIHPLGRIKPMNHIFNIGPKPANGAYMIVNAQSARNSWDSFEVASGPSTRRIIDFSSPLESWGILPSGNSGHLADQFYDNQWQDYLDLQLQNRKLSYSQVIEAHSFIEFKPVK